MHRSELLYTAANIEISLERESKILFCRWIGFQHENALRETGQIIYDLLKQNNCSKILNDNTEVIGPWYHSVEWTANKWFPDMIEAGLKHFAWVCSKDLFAQLSAKRALPGDGVVKTFYLIEEGIEWLKSKK